MKRDMELIRDILVFIEEYDDPSGPGQITSENHSPSEVTYHVEMLVEAGYVKATDVSTHAGRAYLVKGLTMRGHDLAASLQDPDVWGETRKRLGDRFGRATLEVIVGVAVAIAKEKVAEYTGLKL